MSRRLSNPLFPLLTSLLLPILAIAQTLPSDPALVTGELDNGLKYIVRKHAYPPGRATVWIHIHSGSLNESDRQRGLAHYLEHMAFNGSENFPPGAVVPFFQSLGMTFGRDQNAFTNFEQTTYQLSLPDAKPETVAKGMTFFADVLHRLALTPKEIESERQIIQEERRRGLSGRQRTEFYVLEHIAPGSLYGERITIGTEESIGAVQEADFRDYYGKWYVASNATVMVVADAEPDQIVGAIKDKFGSAPKKPRPTQQDPRVKAYDKTFAIVTSDAELRSEDIRVVRLEPARPPTTTVAQMRDDLVDAVGQMAMNRRFQDKIAKGGTTYVSARVGTGNDGNAVYTAEATARANPGKWKPALQELALEVQRARAFGFASREIDDVKKEMIAGAERAVETESTAPAQALISRMNGRITDGEPIMSPQQRLELLGKLLPSISGEEVAKRFAAEFEPTKVAFVAVLPAGPGVPTEAELIDVGTKAFAVQPTKEAETEHATVLMKDLPKPGTITEGAEHASTKVWSGWLSNNVRVHYRFMDDRKNEVTVRIGLIGGELLEGASNRGVTQASQLAWGRPATDTLTSTDIRELMTGKKISVRGGGFGGGRGGGGRRGGGAGGGAADSISLTISGSPEDLETGFQLAHLLLTKPKIEAAAFEQFVTTSREMLEEASKNPMMLGMRTASAAPYPDNEPRTQPLTIENVNKLDLAAAQAWLDKLTKESPIEVVIVGDIPRDRVMELTARYVGSLPSRERITPGAYASLRKLARPTGPRIVEKSLETATAQSFVLSGFYGADETNIEDTLALNMAARVLSTRMIKEVREEAQLVYSIGAGSRPGSTYPGFGVFSAAAPTEPAKAPALVAKLASMYEAFAKSGPTAEELDVAKKQLANTRDEELRDPGYWLRQLDQLTFRGASLDDIIKEGDRYQAMMPEQVKSVFAKYYAEKNSIVVLVRPTETDSSKPAKTPDAEKPQR